MLTMMRACALLFVFFLSGCGKGEKGTRSSSASCLTPDSSCESFVIAENVVLFGEGSRPRWISRTSWHVYELGPDAGTPLDLGPVRNFYSSVWDDDYWYRVECVGKCSYDDLSVVRISRANEERVTIGRGGEIHVVVLAGEYVYWGVWGEYGPQDRVWRVLRGGGLPEAVKLVRRSTTSDPVVGLTVYPEHGILVEGAGGVSWIPLGSGADGATGTVVLEGRAFMGPSVFDGGDSVYALQKGQHFGQDVSPAGKLFRVSLADSTETLIAERLREPSALVSHRENIYVMLKGSSDIIRIPKDGGVAQTIFSKAPYQDGEETIKMWAHESGIVWLHGKACSGCGGILELVRWDTLGAKE